MECLNCGCENKKHLCNNCISENVLDIIFDEIIHYNPETCSSKSLVKYIEAYENPYIARDCIPDILDLFDKSISEYYYCRYYRMIHDEKFEELAINYLNTHDILNMKKQFVLYDLLDYYLRDDFIKPQKWCELIKETDDLYFELYRITAQFFAMVGDYDIADKVIKKAFSYCNDSTYENFLQVPRENAIEMLERLSKDVIRYRTKRPYWPSTEKRRRAVAAIYEKKGIAHPRRIDLKPKKIKESEFEPIKESFEKPDLMYCSFWCAEVSSMYSAKDIYQIAAIIVKNGVIVDEFQSFIRPQKSSISAKKSAAREVGVNLTVLEAARDVDQVMNEFFPFVKNNVLVSTDALGNQAKLISRAARYSGMKSIPNLFFDLLDYAADISSEFDMQNNNREYLLSYFKINEGKSSLEKARANIKLYNHLMELDK